jgi:hypothetical protein
MERGQRAPDWRSRYIGWIVRQSGCSSPGYAVVMVCG